MLTMSATQARNNIGKLWETASHEPVTIESAGKPVAVVLSPQEYDKLNQRMEPRRIGFAKDLLQGIDVDEWLAIPIDDMFADYMP